MANEMKDEARAVVLSSGEVPILYGERCPDCKGSLECKRDRAYCFRCKSEFRLPEAKMIFHFCCKVPDGPVRDTLFEIEGRHGLWAEPVSPVAKQRPGFLASYHGIEMKLICCRQEWERNLRRILGPEPPPTG